MGYRPFWSERRLPNGMTVGDELAILKTADPYAILQVKQTNGANYGVFLPDILARLEAWKALCEIDVIGAASSWVALRFVTLPAELCPFAGNVYAFCPDSVEQGVGLLDEGDDPALYARAREICPDFEPDVSKAAGLGRTGEMVEQFKAALGSMGQNRPDQGGDLLRAAGFDEAPLLEFMQRVSSELSAPGDMGVRLLAAEIERSKGLFLWWD